MSTLRNVTTGQIVATNVQVADGVLSRMVGLLNRPHVEPSEGLWFPGCSTIHTVGMHQDIDVVFLDEHNRVVRALTGVRPNRLAVSCLNAKTVVELGAGALSGSDVLIGDTFRLES